MVDSNSNLSDQWASVELLSGQKNEQSPRGRL